jgi:GTP diphosphokinase / guanosine-3',5'-bis(diphosphate) 3'-diphosphatase
MAATFHSNIHLFFRIFLSVADRLHTMRTLRSLPVGDAEKLKIAEEALNVYAPLAHRMGMMKVKGELEDLAFKHLHPEIFQVS